MAKEIDDWMTPEELAQELWGDYLGEGDMPEIAFNANTDWLKAIFIRLKIGGIWGWMEANRVFKKVSDTHFVEIG